ncbi:MAG: septum formation initiator family protein [Candidatus Falkowbacteria bacterium]
MSRDKYKINPAHKVQYVQKGRLGGNSFGQRMMTSQWPVTILALVVLVFVSMPTVKNYLKQKELDREIADVSAEATKYEDRNKDVKNMLHYLESDQSVEDRGRLNLGLKKQGENVIVISRTNKVEGAGQAGGAAMDDQSNPQKWWRYFFD